MKASHTSLTLILSLTGALLAAACVPAPDSTPAPTPGPAAQEPVAAPTPAPPSVPDPAPQPAQTYENWIDAPRTPGNWSITLGSFETVAKYGTQDAEPLFSMVCDSRSNRITMIRPDSSAGPVQTQVRTESTDRVLTMTPAERDLPGVLVTLPASDALFDAIAVTRGRFAVESLGMPTLYLPPWAEVTRVIEDCR